MKKIKYILATLALIATCSLSSCVGDLDVTPIDPNTVLPQDVLKDQDAFPSLLAKC